MESCLAETGIGFYTIVGLTLMATAFAVAVLGYRRSKNIGAMGYGALVFALSFAFSPMPVSAAVSCDPAQAVQAAALPDSSTGVQGVAQTYSVLDNDTPSAGATFVPSTLTLGLAPGHVLGTSVSSDKKTVTTPNEGVYAAGNNGSITFTPEADFVGDAVGVSYSIEDTAGVVVSSLYTPTVTAGSTPEVCENAPEVMALGSRGYAIQSNVARGAVSNPSPPTIIEAVSATGLHYFATASPEGGGYYGLKSADSGQTWQTVVLPTAVHDIERASISNNGQSILVVAYMSDDWDKEFFHSVDGGDTWTSRGAMDGSWLAELAPLGQAVAKYDSGDGAVSVSTDGAQTWSALSMPGGDFVNGAFDVAISSDGQTVALLGSDATFDPVVAVTTDGGVSWVTRTASLMGAESLSKISVSPSGDLVAIYGTDGTTVSDTLYLSSDDGATWQSEFGDGRYLSLDPMVANNGTIAVLLEGYDVGLDRIVQTLATSDDGGLTWTENQLDLGYGDVTHISADGSVVSGYSSVFGRFMASTDGGDEWSTYLISSLRFNPGELDLNPAQAGQQLTIDRTATEGWSASYDVTLDLVTFTITDDGLYTTSYPVENEGPIIPYQIVDASCGYVEMEGTLEPYIPPGLG